MELFGRLLKVIGIIENNSKKWFQITILVYAWWFVVISMIPVFAILGKSLSEMYFVVIMLGNY